jgi:hypothetical protein
MIIAVGCPFRLLDWAKEKFDFATFPNEQNTRIENRELFEQADGIIICFDRESLQPKKSIGSKLELRYALDTDKLLAVYLDRVRYTQGNLKGKFIGLDLPNDAAYLQSEDNDSAHIL